MVNPMITMHNLTRCSHVKTTKKFGLTNAGEADIVLMAGNGVTNLCEKTLSKLINCFLVMLIKMP